MKILQIQCIPGDPGGEWMFRDEQGMKVEYAGHPSSVSLLAKRAEYLKEGYHIEVVRLPSNFEVGTNPVLNYDWTIKSTERL